MELADSIKRLRELAERTEVMTEQFIFKSVRQINMHPEQGRNDVLTLSDGVISANATINQLVELVAEMRETAGLVREWLRHYDLPFDSNPDWPSARINLDETLTKADALLSALKEK